MRKRKIKRRKESVSNLFQNKTSLTKKKKKEKEKLRKG
jgi:hypothetical protein